MSSNHKETIKKSSGRFISFIKHAFSVVQSSRISPYSCKYLRRDFTQYQLLKLLLFKEYRKEDYRTVIWNLEEMDRIREVLDLTTIPHFTTLQKFLCRIKSLYFDSIRYRRLFLVETKFSILKRRFGADLKSRIFQIQKKEISCKIILANIDRFIQFVWIEVFYRAKFCIVFYSTNLEGHCPPSQCSQSSWMQGSEKEKLDDLSFTITSLRTMFSLCRYPVPYIPMMMFVAYYLLQFDYKAYNPKISKHYLNATKCYSKNSRNFRNYNCNLLGLYRIIPSHKPYQDDL